MKVMVETSARHVHVSEADLKTLFGADAKLTVKKELSQPGQYASNEKVEVIGPKGSLVMSILGPTRPETQVEVALTDARKLGIAAPIRESGDLEGTPGCTLKGPAGEVVIEKGVIAAKRHIHLTPEDAARFGVADRQRVRLQCFTSRPLVFQDVEVRVSPQFSTVVHIDYDEANACGFQKGDRGVILK